MGHALGGKAGRALRRAKLRRSAKTRRETLAAALMLQASSTIVFLAI
jgi:hypothetical protein